MLLLQPVPLSLICFFPGENKDVFSRHAGMCVSALNPVGYSSSISLALLLCPDARAAQVQLTGGLIELQLVPCGVRSDKLNFKCNQWYLGVILHDSRTTGQSTN